MDREAADPSALTREQSHEAQADAKAVAHAHAAINSMFNLGIAPTPENFAIWHDYHSGHRQMVRRVLDVYLSNSRPIDRQVMQQLHETFYFHDSDLASFLNASQRAQQMLASAADKIADAGATSKSFGASLGEASKVIAVTGKTDADTFSQLADRAADMARQYSLVSDELSTSVSEVKALRRELDAARREASTDALTGLPNRRSFDARLRSALAEAAEQQQPCSLLMADIDRFKTINDKWGHPVGDAVLRRVAQVIPKVVDASHLPARFGGEEFGVICVSTPASGAQSIAERIRVAVRDQNFAVRATGQNIGTVTISIGVASSRGAESAAAFIGRADAALYRAKSLGRDQVAIHDANV